MNRYTDTAKAVMIGHAVADALGVPVEFRTREELDAAPVVGMRGFGSHPVPAGTWSDDTSMSLATLDSLAKGKVDYNDIMENFARWYNLGEYTATGKLFDIGGACMTAIRNYLSNDGKSALSCGLSDEYANGNGSLMRIHPLVLYAYAKKLPKEEWSALIKNGSAITHAHERSVLGCLIYAFVLFHLLEEASLDALKRGLACAKRDLSAYAEINAYARIFQPNFSLLPRAEIQSSGYVVDTLEAALWCIMTTTDYSSCVLKAVNLGEDTDTVAAVAGGLAGALYGYEAIPSEWREMLIGREEIEALCESVFEC